MHLLRPVGMDGIVNCKIEHVSLNDTPKPTFVALSYAWGDPHVTRPILLGDVVVQVTENLEAALRQFQKRHFNSGEQTYPFWIDALCVNQTDNKDKTVQVQRMGRHFRVQRKSSFG